MSDKTGYVEPKLVTPAPVAGGEPTRAETQAMIASLLAATAPFAGPSVDWYRLSPLLILLGGGLVLLVGAALTGERWPRAASPSCRSPRRRPPR